MITTRFAPAPTGWLHLGHVANAIYVWGLAGAAGGRVLLRIEDHDRQRSRAAFERGILDDLEWLGFVPDAPAIHAFRSGWCDGRQRDRQALYAAALEQLIARDLVYACNCSRAEIAAASTTAGAERRYPGTCAGKQLPFEAGFGLRVRLEDRDETFVDLRHGPLTQNPFRQCGDMLIRDRDGNWTYQCAVTVDDFEQRVSHVIRGDDLLASTGRQIQLARLLGRIEAPVFLHHALIMKSDTQKLSKADSDTSVREMRAAGRRPDDVIGEAAALVGLIERAGPVSPADTAGLVARFRQPAGVGGSRLA